MIPATAAMGAAIANYCDSNPTPECVAYMAQAAAIGPYLEIALAIEVALFVAIVLGYICWPPA